MVCAMQSWQEDSWQEYIAGRNCCFPNPEAVQALLHWKSYAQVWTSVPKEELRASAVQLRWYPEKLLWEAYSEPLLLHKRRITNAMKEGSARANLCHDCYKSLTKQTPEMPTCALANGRWLGRHQEIMRSMPCGHRLLLQVRRVILTRVIFTNDVKNPWERSHSQKGLDGVTVVVQQASAVERVLEYPPKDLGETFQAVFAGLDPTDTRKAQQSQKIPLGMQQAFYMRYCLLDEMGCADPNSVRWEIQTRWGLCTINLVFGQFTRHRSRPGNRWAQVTGLDLAPWWQPL